MKGDAGDAKDASHFRFGSSLAAELGRFGLPVVGPAQLGFARALGTADDTTTTTTAATGTRGTADPLPGDFPGRRQQLPAARFRQRRRRQEPQRRCRRRVGRRRVGTFTIKKPNEPE